MGYQNTAQRIKWRRIDVRGAKQRQLTQAEEVRNEGRTDKHIGPAWSWMNWLTALLMVVGGGLVVRGSSNEDVACTEAEGE
jgi:hypothetical protein